MHWDLLYKHALYIYNKYIMLRTTANKYLFNNEKLQKFSNFLYSDYYFLSIVLFVVLMWGLGLIASGPCIIIGISVLLLCIAGILVIQKDVMPIVPIIIMTMCVMSLDSVPSYIWIGAFFAGIVVIAAIFHIIYYGIGEFKFGKMFFPMFLFFIVSLLGGLGSRLPNNIMGGVNGALLIVLAPLFVYLVLLNGIDTDKSVSEYIAKTLMYFGLIMAIEMGLFYIVRPEFLYEIEGVPHLGFAVSNSVATYLLITIPMSFYLYVKTDKKIGYFYLLAGLVEFISIILTTSRGGTIFGIIEVNDNK